MRAVNGDRVPESSSRPEHGGLSFIYDAKLRAFHHTFQIFSGGGSRYYVLGYFFSLLRVSSTFSNGSNFAMCNRDKIHAPAHTLYYTPDEDRHQGRKTQACQPLYIIYKVSHSSRLHRVQRNTARCLFRDLKRFRGPKPYRNNLARVGQGNSPKSNFPKDACGAWN